MIADGELGEIMAIRATYIQGWLVDKLEDSDQKQAAWRTDPKRSGAAGCFGDIATHAFNLGRYVTGLLPEKISCHLKTFVEGRLLDDYGHALVTYENGAFGTVTASQISHGRENDVTLEVDGTKGSLSWRQENPNELCHRGTRKRFSKPSLTFIAMRLTTCVSAFRAKTLKRKTPSTPTCLMASKACTSFSSAFRAATMAALGCP